LSKIISSVVLAFGVYRLLSHFQISEDAILWTSSISSILPSILLLNTDLYANFFAYAVSFLFFSALLDYLQNPNGESLVISSLSLIIIAFIHVETYLLVLSVTFIFVIVSRIFSVSRCSGALYPALKIILPSIASLLPFALLSITNLHYFGILSNYLGPANQRYGLTFFSEILDGQSYSADPIWGNGSMIMLLIQGIARTSSSISPIINLSALVLVLLGATLTRLDTNAHKLLFSMNFTMIVCILNLYGIVDILPARLALFYPSSLLIGLGLNWASARIELGLNWARTRIARTNKRIGLKFREKSFNLRTGTCSETKLKTVLFAFILLYSVAVAVNIRITFDSGVYAPNANVLDEITRLEEMFGYGNESVIILVKPEQNWGRSTEWTEAITGGKVYLGHILNIVNNQTLEDAYSTLEQPVYYSQGLIGSWNHLRIGGVLGHLQNYTFVISEELYYPDPQELKMLVEISDGIYILNRTYLKFT
jgi:hypothetical protein